MNSGIITLLIIIMFILLLGSIIKKRVKLQKLTREEFEALMSGKSPKKTSSLNQMFLGYDSLEEASELTFGELYAKYMAIKMTKKLGDEKVDIKDPKFLDFLKDTGNKAHILESILENTEYIYVGSIVAELEDTNSHATVVFNTPEALESEKAEEEYATKKYLEDGENAGAIIRSVSIICLNRLFNEIAKN